MKAFRSRVKTLKVKALRGNVSNHLHFSLLHMYTYTVVRFL